MSYVDVNNLSGLGRISTDTRYQTVNPYARSARAPVSREHVTPKFGRARVVPVMPVTHVVPRPVSRIPTKMITMPGRARKSVISRLMPTKLSPGGTVRRMGKVFDRFMRKQRGYPPEVRTSSGALQATTKIRVVKGVDRDTRPISKHGAATTGQSVSIKTETSNTAVVTEVDGHLRIEPRRVPKPEGPKLSDFIKIETPTIDVRTPETFIEAAVKEPSPILKYGLLGIGAWILMSSFKNAPPTRRRRRSSRRR